MNVNFFSMSHRFIKKTLSLTALFVHIIILPVFYIPSTTGYYDMPLYGIPYNPQTPLNQLTAAEVIRLATDINQRFNEQALGPGVIATAVSESLKKLFIDSSDYKELLRNFALFSIGSYAAKRALDVLKEYAILRLTTPRLVQRILTPTQITKSLTDLLYTGKTNNRIQDVIETTKGVVNNKNTGYFHSISPFRDTSKGRARFENVMLWGPPGTGKTAIAEIIAKEAGMNLFVTSGGDFAKLRGKDLQQIDELFKTMRSSGRPCLLFIDEMEDLFGARGNKSEESRQIFTKLLTEFSEPSNQIMLIGATNRPEDIDEAMHRRMPAQIEISYPNKAGRIKIFKLYKNILFNKDSMYNQAQLAEINKVFSDKTIHAMEKTIGTISPAEIANIMRSIKNKSLAHNKGIPTQAIIDKVLQDKKEQLHAIQHGFKRTDIEALELETMPAA